MSLLCDELRSRLPPIGAQKTETDPVVYAKFFLPGTCWAWYVTEGEPQGEDFLFFGFVTGLENEFGYSLLSELHAIRSPRGRYVERALAFTEGRLTDVVPAPDV